MLSIIIPTLNEENYLPRLLECLRKQREGGGDFEVIAADAGSQDRTREIAEAFGCRVVKGGLPAKGRNEGAKTAKGDLLLFLDADVILPEDFLYLAIKEFKKRNLDIAAFSLIPLSKKKSHKFLFNFFYNYPLKVLEDKWSHGAMGILAKKWIHQKIGGFDEGIKIAEDHHYVQRASRIGKFGMIKSSKIFISLRRIRKEGWVRVGLKYSFTEIYMKFKGPVRKEFFQYKFNHYDKES